MTDQDLRMWCLERAFETRALSNVPHMEVTNVAENYFRWVRQGESQRSRVMAEHAEMADDEPWPSPDDIKAALADYERVAGAYFSPEDIKAMWADYHHHPTLGVGAMAQEMGRAKT